MFRSRILAALILTGCMAAMFSMDAMAQARITGKVVDASSGEAEVGAIVQLYAGEALNENLEGYAVCDTLGAFSLLVRSPRNTETHIIQVSNLGRKTIERRLLSLGTDIDLGTLGMEDDAQTLNSAKVSAAKPLIKMDADKIAYDVESDVDSKASTVLEMLRKVPMVAVDGQDNITVNGSSSFKVYVDGKPNQMLSSNPSQIFKSMPASSVQSIEVITNPGAKYDAEGTGGVLNLITARSPGASSAIPDGANGTVSAGLNSMGSLQGGIFANAKKGKLTVGANLNGGAQKNKGITFDSTQESTDGMVLRSVADDMTQSMHMVFGDLNASYDHDSLNLFSASIGIQHWKYESSGISSTQGILSGAPLFAYDGDGLSGGHQTGVNASADWQHSFAGNHERTFTLSYRLSREPEFEYSETHYSNIAGASVSDRKTDGKDMSTEHTVQADFTTPLFKGQNLSTGVKFIYRHNFSDDKFWLDNGSGFALEDVDDNYRHYNYIAAAYGEWSGSFGAFSLKGGLRYEHTWQDINYTDGRSFSGKYGNLVPNMSVQYNLTPISNLALTYNLRIRRPGISYLCPFVNRSSATSITYGDSGIEPEKTHSAMLKYNYFSPKLMANFSLAWRYGEGGISSYSFYGPDPDDSSVNILHNTYGNIVRTNTAGANWFLSWNPAKDTRVYTSADVGYNDFYSKVLGQRNSGFTGNMMLGAQHTIAWDIRFSAYLFASLRHYNLQGWNSGFSGLGLRAGRNFLQERLGVTLGAFTNLDGAKATFKGSSTGAGFSSVNITKVPIRQISLELSWKFGNTSYQVKKARRSISNDDVVNAERSDAASQASQIQ